MTSVDPAVTAAAAITAVVEMSPPHSVSAFCSSSFQIRGGCVSETSDISVAILSCANIFRNGGRSK